MVSPNLQRFSSIPRGERLVPHRTKKHSRFHPKSSILRQPDIHGDERTFAYRSESDYTYSCHVRNPAVELRDDFPPQRDRTDEMCIPTAGQHDPSFLSLNYYKSESVSSRIISSPPRIFRRGIYRDDEKERTAFHDTRRDRYPFPVQAQSQRTDASQKSNLFRIPLSLCGHQTIGDPSLNIHRLRLPNQLLPVLDQSKFTTF